MSDEIVVWYRDDCSKCRRVRELLEESGVPFRLRAFLDEPPDAAEIEAVVARLGGDPAILARELADGAEPKDLPRAELIAALARSPASIQRPIAIRGERALVARPPERVLELLCHEPRPVLRARALALRRVPRRRVPPR